MQDLSNHADNLPFSHKLTHLFADIKKIHEIENEIEENISTHDKILFADNPRYAYTEYIAYLVYKKYPIEAMNILFEFFLHCPEYKYPIYRKLLEWQKTKPS